MARMMLRGAAGTPSGTPSATPPSSPPAVPADFPLAVVTGMTNLKSTIGLDEVASLASRGRLVMPCGVVIQQHEVSTGAACRPANRIGRYLQKHQQQVAFVFECDKKNFKKQVFRVMRRGQMTTQVSEQLRCIRMV